MPVAREATGPRGPGRRRRGSPESEDLPPALKGNGIVAGPPTGTRFSIPLAEGGFVSRLVLGLLVAALVTLVASSGSPAAPAAVPHRIVSLSATATESLFAIGAGPQVVAVDDQSDYPKSAPRTALSGFTPNVEAIATYRPDLVVIAYDPKGLSGALERLGITVLHQDGAKSFKGAYQQIRQLGLVTGQDAAAKRVVSGMKQRIATITRNARKARSGLSVYHELTPDLY